MNWDDLKIVLFVSEKGSASGAARSLGVNHATVVRRIKSLEETLGVRIFDHSSSGYRITNDGRQFVEAARAMSDAVLDLQRKVTGSKSDLQGPVRLTTTDGLFPLVTDDLKRLHELYPGIDLDLVITNQQISLKDLDADLAIRTSLAKPEGLVSERVSSVNFAIYASTPHTPLDSSEMTVGQRWIGLSPPLSLSAPGRWLEEQVPRDAFVMRCNSFLQVRSLVEHGLGVGILPCFLGDTAETLQRVRGQPFNFTNHIWIVSHKDVLRAPRIKACFDFFLDAMRRKQPVLSGTEDVDVAEP